MQGGLKKLRVLISPLRIRYAKTGIQADRIIYRYPVISGLLVSFKFLGFPLPAFARIRFTGND
jgi:hypothetical protein